MLYPRVNTRKCYWLCPECLKERSRCSTRCPDYLSVAQAERIKKERQAEKIEREVTRYASLDLEGVTMLGTWEGKEVKKHDNRSDGFV